MSSNLPFAPSPLAQPPAVTLPDGSVAVQQDKKRPPPFPTFHKPAPRTLLGSPNISNPPSVPPSPSIQDPTERLLPPGSAQRPRFRDDDVISLASTSRFGKSRRTSWNSDSPSRIYSPNPFDDSRAASIAGSDDDNINTQTVSEKYNILPSAGLLLFPEDVEKDDYLHNPDPNDKDGLGCDIFNRRGMSNICGIVFMLVGMLALLIVWPTITFIQNWRNGLNPCSHFANCVKTSYTPSLLNNIRTKMIDPDTDKKYYTKLAKDGQTTLQLVFSDEFNTPGRTFYPGDDPYFEAVDLWYGVTGDLEWYDPDAVTTVDGHLEIRFDAFQNHNLNYRSGMMQSWNKMCFTGGHLEASISLPGRGDTIGLWPGFWTMGNLGRPGHAATTDGLWPYSYDNICDAGITPNQSSTDGISYLPGMRLPACTCSGEDHPSPGVSRSAPEIDVIEASVGQLDALGNMIGQVSQSAQMAPFDPWYYLDYNYVSVQDDTISSVNGYTGGVYQQAASVVSSINNDWYDGNAYQTYAYEYDPGSEGSVTWFIGDTQTWTLDARASRPNGNVGQRPIPMEPMALVMNLGMSNGFVSFLNHTGIAPLLPVKMRFDYIRIYQDTSKHTTGCDPPGYPTTQYIADHRAPYDNVNLTQWGQTYGTYPKNALMHGCQAEDGNVPITFPS